MGSVVLLSSRWCDARKLSILLILSCIGCLSVSVYLICGLYGYQGRYFNAMNYVKAMFKIGDDYRRPFIFGGNPAEVVTNWPKSDDGTPEYPNWTLILSLTLQKGSLVTLCAF